MIKVIIIAFFTGAWCYQPTDADRSSLADHYEAGQMVVTPCEAPANEAQRCIVGDTVFVSRVGWVRIDSVTYYQP